MEVLAVPDRASEGDDALLRLAAHGDLAAFDRLIAGRLDRCYRLAWSILENDADAADATQDAFVTAWRELPRLRQHGAFDGWLNRIVANAALTIHRRRRRRREVQVAPAADIDSTQPAGEPFAVPASSDIESVAENDAIQRAFASLRPEDRAILALHHVDEQPLAVIARTLGIPVGTAKSRLHAARRTLERAMEAQS